MTTEIWTHPRRSGMTNEVKFKPIFETTGLKELPDKNKFQNLYLIATKRNNYTYEGAPAGKIPVDEGYLYLDEKENKLYYSCNMYNNPEYLFDWDKSLAKGRDCNEYHALFTPDGDVIFFYRPYNNARENPIFYPAGDYNNPEIVDFGDHEKPFSFLWDNGYDFDYKQNFFIFAEYRTWNLDHVGSPLYIWKVEKPYNDPANWRIVDTWYHTHYNNPTEVHPNKAIGHFHTLNRDFYSGEWIASTGDMEEQCRIITSRDDGESWEEVPTPGGQMVRMVGFIFLKDAIYWQTDSTGKNHKLYKVLRDSEGYPDFSNIIKVCDLSETGEAGYCTAYMRSPHGLLFLDRTEPRRDGLLDFYFYSFEFEKPFHLGTYNRVEGDQEGRHGFPVLAYTHYQSPYEDGIICGSTTKTKPFTLDILDNTEGNLKGVLKIKVVRVQ